MHSFSHRAAAVVAFCVLTGAAQAAFTYDFSSLAGGTVPGANENPAPGGVSWQGTTTIGQIGPDNWAWNSSNANVFGAIARNNSSPGMSGTYISAYPTAATSATGAIPAPYDTINSRKNTASGFNYAIPNGSTFTVGFTASVSGINYTNASGQPSTTTSRAQVALGFDQNADGDIRGDSVNSENAEWGPLFGFEPAGVQNSTTAGLVGKWYVRPASLGTAVLVNAGGPGVYRIELAVNPNANPVAATTNNYAGNDGSGTLYVQQLFDAFGVPVVDTLHAVTGLINVNLGLTRMNAHNSTNVGTINGYNPAFWDGLVTRVSNNGAIDDISITITPEPAALSLLLGATLFGRSRRRR